MSYKISAIVRCVRNSHMNKPLDYETMIQSKASKVWQKKIRILSIYIWFETCFVHFQPGFHLMNLKWTKAPLKKVPLSFYSLLCHCIESKFFVTRNVLHTFSLCTCIMHGLHTAWNEHVNFFQRFPGYFFSLGRHEVFNLVHGSM